MSVPWWIRHVGRMEYEMKALQLAQIEYTRDEEAFAAGVLRLLLKVPTTNGIIDLIAQFPDLYPYFRIEVFGRDLGLKYHWNPFWGNLCLLGRRTHAWSEEDTLAKLLLEQLPKLLRVASTKDAPREKGIEQQQAEPFSEYYPSSDSVLLIDSGWEVDHSHRSGRLLIGTDVPPRDRLSSMLRGAVLEIRSETGQVLCSADAPMRSTFAGQRLWARWARMPKPIVHADDQFLRELFRVHPHVQNTHANRVRRGWLHVWGVLFPEEVNYRQQGEGWIFACVHSKTRDMFGSPRKTRGARPELRSGSKVRRR